MINEKAMIMINDIIVRNNINENSTIKAIDCCCGNDDFCIMHKNTKSSRNKFKYQVSHFSKNKYSGEYSPEYDEKFETLELAVGSILGVYEIVEVI